MGPSAHVRYEDTATTPPSEQATPGRSRRTIAWGLLVVGLVAGLAAWLSARETTVRDRESFGHGHLPYRDVDTTTNPYLAAAAVAAPLAGIGSWALLLTHGSRRSKVIYAALTVCVIGAGAGGTYAAVREAQRLHFEPGEYYAGVRDVAAEMERRDIACARAAGATLDSSYFGTALDCAIPAELAINDGFDDASIRTWTSEDARDRWLRAAEPAAVNAVVGPTWIVVCEFEATCWEIQSKIGGRHH
ncbi:MAG: hypothetical protein M3214_06310 [Actinomycetota bacterium]|nr:hypothetical protein [Actinomycetota bacterium]